MSDVKRTKLGRIMRRFRMMNGLTQAELGKRAGLSTFAGKNGGFSCPVVANMEAGYTVPDPKNMMKLGRALRVQPGLVVQLACWDELTDRERDSVEEMCDKILLDPDWRNAPKAPSPEAVGRWENA